MRAGTIIARARFAAVMAVAVAAGACPPAARADVPAPRAGWKIELLAQAPDVSHPSVVTTAPDGRIFVAEDPMDIREDVPPDARSGRVLCFHPDGRRTVFATGLHAVFGMQYLEGRLHVLHNPLLTVFRDDDGVGREPRDILRDTLPEPWALGWNDHIPANFKLGMDGYFYLAVGDKGLFGCTGSDGRRLDLRGGGVVRFRPDGSGLEVFATGVRNILDVAVNAEDELFTYDNTDEHQWMGRLSHMVEGGYYGYPHDFIPRRPYTLWMMHDFGAGAACGTVCTTDDALPPAMAGNLFLSDFGKRQITRAVIERDGATWRVTGSEDLFPNPPDDFRPVGLDWTPDGRSLLVCDWQHRDHKANVSVGRLWKLSWTGPSSPRSRPDWWVPLAMGQSPRVAGPELVEAMAHPARSVRLTAQRALAARAAADPAVTEMLRTVLVDGARPTIARVHALWALSPAAANPDVVATVWSLAGGGEPAVAAQALRWLGQRRAAGSMPAALGPLAHPDAAVRLQAAVLVGRLAGVETAASLEPSVEPVRARLAAEGDATVRHALVLAWRRFGEASPALWAPIVAGLGDARETVRDACRFALRGVWTEPLIPLLRERALGDPVAAGLLRDLVFQPEPNRGAWWAYHPAKSPPPAPATRWAGTDAALAALRTVLASGTDADSRREAAAALGAARETASIAALRDRLAQDPSPAVQAAALEALAAMKDEGTAPLVGRLLGDETAPAPLRLAAVTQAPAFGDTLAAPLAALLAPATPEAVRLAAIAAVGPMKAAGARAPLAQVLANGSTAEKSAALHALALFADPALTPALLAALEDPEAEALRRPALLALAATPDPRATGAYLDALALPDPVVTEAAGKALTTLGPAALPGVEAHLDALGPGVRGRLRRLFQDNADAVKHPVFARLPAIDTALYEKAGLDPGGDPWRGQQVFFGAAGTSCVACHQVAGVGGVLGPDLTLAGRQFGRAELVESILHPARVVRDGYALVAVTTLDGRERTGALRGDTGEGITLADLAGQTTLIPRAEVADRRPLGTSLMPEGLHAALTPDQFKDLLAYLVSRTSDPRRDPPPPLPEGFVPLFNGRDLAGWSVTDQNRAHWSVRDGRLVHDGGGGDLWSEQAFGDADVLVEWRWPGPPQLVEFPVIDADGRQLDRSERVLDAGDSGLFLRGHRMAQVNLFCYPVGSGEFWEYRERLDGDARRAVTPSQRADAPLGDWNTMDVSLRGDRVTIRLNGLEVIEGAHLPDLPPRGPIGFQHEHGPLEIRRVAVRPRP
jgi:putative heme-binding domain-containing protein